MRRATPVIRSARICAAPAKAMEEVCEAADFYDRVMASSASEKAAVGNDHIDWMIRAGIRLRDARKVK